ncbi:divalent metal cation transporter [Cloacibacillus sp. An23]|uniref:NRAMP family divalent metal transporter n=1 Tax=Cloacibacillus sp. An23 TaxID=1965591 RepID=UPI000B3752FA|nr:divalent metal cation transporter [Cloacibacillus sp. An23]OUO94287.1 hypothetical protein B5F39_03435 [Cloacibacillus sp. An23]
MANAQQRNVDEFQLPKGGLIKKLMYIMAFIGPASMLCSTSMGPGTASSCIQAGSMFGYDLLWAIVLSGIMCGGVAYIGAKATALSGKDVFELIRERIGNVACSILFVVVLITWYMVIYSQGSIMRHLNDIMFGEQAAAVAYVVTILLIAYLYYASTNNRIIKMASIMCTVMAIIFFINVFYVRPNIGQLIGGMVPKRFSLDEAIIIAGVIGGSAPGTSALWYSYSVKNQQWDKPSALGFIKWDQIVFAAMFTIFSLGIFLSGAAVLFPAGIKAMSAVEAAKALEPLAGVLGTYIFIAGLWGAVFTTIGGMSTLGSYCLNSLFHISKDNSDVKVRRLILIGIVISLFGGMSGGNAMSLLVNFLGLLNIGGLVIITILTYLTSNSKFSGQYKNKWYTTLMGLIILGFNAYSTWTYIARFL